MVKVGILLLIAVVLGTMRAMGHASSSFQAAAHLFVGGLIGAWMQEFGQPLARDVSMEHFVFNRLFYGLLAVALTVLEVVCFLVFRFT